MQYIAMMYTEESWLDYGTMVPLIFWCLFIDDCLDAENGSVIHIRCTSVHVMKH